MLLERESKDQPSLIPGLSAKSSSWAIVSHVPSPTTAIELASAVFVIQRTEPHFSV
jgi:hypothetical protein